MPQCTTTQQNKHKKEKEWSRRENNGLDETIWGIKHAYIEMSQ
jgi:hypothetical protein